MKFDDEIVGEIFNLCLGGYPPHHIVEQLKNRVRDPKELSNKTPKTLLAEAVANGWIQFVSPRENDLSRQIQERFSRSHRHFEVDVTFTHKVEDVASRAAFRVLKLIERQAMESPAEEVHVGFSGGHTIKRVFQKLTDLLSRSFGPLPETLVCHALVAGFDTKTPGSDPTSFFTYMADKNLPLKTEFLLLHAPPIVAPGEMAMVRSSPAIKTALQAQERLHLIVTSAAAFDDRHSQLNRYLTEYSSGTKTKLEQDNCVGDMLWLPINRHGPLPMNDYPHWPVSLLELSQLPQRIPTGLKVLLALGPCVECDGLKISVIDVLLNLDQPYITHLVTDCRTAKELIKRQQQPQESQSKTASASAE